MTPQAHKPYWTLPDCYVVGMDDDPSDTAAQNHSALRRARRAQRNDPENLATNDPILED